ncbi:hypothetical protein GCM10011584_32300 [Nocardioides phosphati]|uniref:DUF4244 domain-containing protein n=3 Tax=Nocardioides phosphati TaxID=1867775 RepID=A0ABQ2NFF5_9ACTN|nr:hypothetical protein GCM10011584_32300 [Nocardioides phosphati]
MKQMTMWVWCLAVVTGAPAPRRERVGRDRGERGDVPGWVLVTIMTAGLVTMLWRFAGPQLQQMLSNALAQVSG